MEMSVLATGKYEMFRLSMYMVSCTRSGHISSSQKKKRSVAVAITGNGTLTKAHLLIPLLLPPLR